MRYLYYPGCSAEATGKAYDISTRAVMAKLGVELIEIDDWNCCGATSYFSVRELDSFAIAARNLAIAQQQGDEDLCRHLQRLLHDARQDQPLHERQRRGLQGRQRRPRRRRPHLRRHQARAPHHGRAHQRHRARGHRRQGHPAPHRPQGGALLRLPVLAAHRHLRRPRVPDHHGRLLQGPGRRRRRLPVQGQVLRRHDDADQRRGRSAHVPRAAQDGGRRGRRRHRSRPARCAR